MVVSIGVMFSSLPLLSALLLTHPFASPPERTRPRCRRRPKPPPRRLPLMSTTPGHPLLRRQLRPPPTSSPAPPAPATSPALIPLLPIADAPAAPRERLTFNAAPASSPEPRASSFPLSLLLPHRHPKPQGTSPLPLVAPFPGSA